MGITHATVATGTDAGTGEIHKAEWNAAHVGLIAAKGCIVSGTSTALSSGNYVSLAFNSADTFDSDGYHDPASSNTLITVPANLDGVYQLSAQCSWPNTTTADTQKRITYRINGGTDNGQIPFRVSIATEASGVVGFGSFSIAVVLSAGDTVEIRQWVTNANSQTTTQYRASLFLIGV